MLCQSIAQNGQRCSRAPKNNEFCWQHKNRCKSYFSLFPSDLKRQLLYLTNPREISHLCLDTEFSKSCNEEFWRNYTKLQGLPDISDLWAGVSKTQCNLSALTAFNTCYNTHI